MIVIRALRLFTIAWFFSINAMPMAAQADEDAKWLIIIHGTVNAATAEGFTLETGPTGIAFTDRPARKVQIIDIARAVGNGWAEDGEFRADPPNASLINESTDTISVIAIVDAAWQEGAVQMSTTNLEGEPPNVGDTVAITIDQSNNNGTWTK
ncbi:hypothetical protein [Roseovarius sp. EL26]|uniref:hypothetical protein n=1 Tax=Roseovarius sp. EL26 TaxID=2126672 RepID=UPI0013C4D8CE|nr:hypothetical protein [Roseovarius sp. EL26]